ncbi:hypothetical protein D3C75_1032840 [compost metagenome]
MAEVNNVIERTQSSVVIKRDAKGNRSYEVKAYSEDVNDAMENALEVMEKLDAEFDLDKDSEEE